MPISFDWLSAFIMALFSNVVAFGEEKANDSIAGRYSFLYL